MDVSKPRSGRPKKLTEDDKARILYVIAECCDMRQLLLRNEAATSEIIPVHLYEVQVDFQINLDFMLYI
jgi:transposase